MKTHELWGLLQTAEQVRGSALAPDDKVLWLREIKRTMPPIQTSHSEPLWKYVQAAITTYVSEITNAPSVSAQATPSDPLAGLSDGTGSADSGTKSEAEASHKGKEARSPSKKANR